MCKPLLYAAKTYIPPGPNSTGSFFFQIYWFNYLFAAHIAQQIKKEIAEKEITEHNIFKIKFLRCFCNNIIILHHVKQTFSHLHDNYICIQTRKHVFLLCSW